MTARAPRDAAIDALKGLAILAVIAQHALPGATLDAIGGDFHIRQAVPVLFVLMGFNAVRAHARRPPDAYDRRYLEGRFWRIGLPFAAVWVLALVVGLPAGRVHLGPLTLVGMPPVPGPGSYFVTILFTFALVWPAWYRLFRRAPSAALALAVGLDAAFELIAGALPSLRDGGYPYGYDAAIFRYLAAIAVGMWLALDDDRTVRRRRAVAALAPLSLLFLAWLQSHPDPPLLVPGFGAATSLAAVPWAALMMVVVLAAWPSRGVRGTGWLEQLGRASYHVFLVQIAWFGLLPDRELWRWPLDALVCGAAGWLLYRALPARRRRRAATRARAGGRAVHAQRT